MIKVAVYSDTDIENALKMVGSKEAVQAVLQSIMAAARAHWIKLAGQRLHSSRRDYINGIQDVVVDGLTASVALVGDVPNMVEQGMSPFDMHDTLLGPNVPVVPAGSGMKGKHPIKGKPGKFWRVVPFRHQGPNTIGQGGGQPMGSQYSDHDAVADAQKLGRKVFAAAKKLAPTTGMPGQKTQWGGRLPEGLAPLLKPHHSTDIYSGMVRMEKEYKGATQSTFMTFRIISDNVPTKFLHPGIEAAHLVDEVDQYVGKIAQAAFGALIAPE